MRWSIGGAFWERSAVRLASAPFGSVCGRWSNAGDKAEEVAWVRVYGSNDLWATKAEYRIVVATSSVPQRVGWVVIREPEGQPQHRSYQVFSCEIPAGETESPPFTLNPLTNGPTASATYSIAVRKVELTNIKFNHDTGSSASDAINIRQDYNTPFDISNGEWVKGGTNIPVCYTTNKTVTIKARFTVQPASITSADIWAVSTDSDGTLGDVVKTTVAFAGGVSVGDANGYVELPVSGNTPNVVKKTTTDTWQWRAENINGASVACDFDMSGPHTVYTILNEPMSPWVNTAGNQRNAWISALDFAVVTCNADGKATEDDVMDALTTHLYTIPYTGASQYLTTGGNFSYTGYMTMTSANCLDSAVGLDTTGSLLGMDMVARRRTEFFNYNFHCFVKKGAYVYDSCSAMWKCIIKMDYTAYVATGTPGTGSTERDETYPIE